MAKKLIVSQKFLDMILNDYFGTPSNLISDTKVYAGLGLDFDAHAFKLDEPVSPGFTILKEPIAFSQPLEGVIRNKNALSWPKAEKDWTVGNQTIKYVGLYYKKDILSEADEVINSEYILFAVLELFPNETILTGDTLVLNTNSIQIEITNK